MLEYLSADIICSEKRTVFRERSSSLEETIISKDKYSCLFSCQMEAIVFVILQLLFVTRAVLKIGEHNQDIPQFQLRSIQSRDPFRQSRASESTWWILIRNTYSVALKALFRFLLIARWRSKEANRRWFPSSKTIVVACDHHSSFDRMQVN